MSNYDNVRKVLVSLSGLMPVSILKRTIKRDSIDVFYHIVSESEPNYVKYLYPVVPADVFRAAIVYLKKYYNFVDYLTLHEHYTHGTKLPKNALHLSFDDGYAECYHVVRPILLEENIPCTFFLTTDFVDNGKLYYRNKVGLIIDFINARSEKEREELICHIASQLGTSWNGSDEFIHWISHLKKSDEEIIDRIFGALDFNELQILEELQPYLTLAQIKEMRQDGFYFGAHTLTHLKLGGLPADEIERQIVQSCQRIREWSGEDVVPFSFPHSAARVDRELLAEMRLRHPYIGLLFDTKGLHRDEPFIVNRIWAERPYGKGRRMLPIKDTIAHAYREELAEEMLSFLFRVRNTRLKISPEIRG